MSDHEIVKDSIKTDVKDSQIVLLTDEQHTKIYKAVLLKTERLVSAVHLVTGLMDTGEKIRHDLRSATLSTMSDLYDLERMTSGAKRNVSDKVLERITYVISLLEVGLTGGLVSQMNYLILKEEYSKLKDVLIKFKLTTGGSSFTLPDLFFGADLALVTEEVSASYQKDIDDISTISLRRKSRNDTDKKTLVRAGKVEVIKDSVRSISKAPRQDLIVKVMKDSVEYTIKDIITNIALADASMDCSNKTIQRDLLSLVTAGVLVKKGERRWSRYSKAMGGH